MFAALTVDIVLAPQAQDDLRQLDPLLRAHVEALVRARLSRGPDRPSRMWIRRLWGQRGPHYRLRVGPVRVFYDVRPPQVWVLAVHSVRAERTREEPAAGPRALRVAFAALRRELARYLDEARTRPVVITRHGKATGLLIGFETEDDCWEHHLRHDPAFLERIEQARRSLGGAPNSSAQ